MNRLAAYTLAILLVILLATGLPSPGPASAAVQPSASRRQDEPSVRTAQHDQTGKLSFLGADPASPIAVEGAPKEGLRAEDRGIANLGVYGEAFGLKDPGQDLTLMRVSSLGNGRAAVRYRQVYEGVPVVAGELIVNLDPGGQLLSISGEVSPDLSLSTTPVLTADEASTIARAAVAKWYGLSEAELGTTDPELWIYDERLLRWSERPPELVWRMEVSPAGLSSIKELVLVNAEAGGISLHFNRIDTVLNRTIYDNNNNSGAGLPGIGPVRTEGGAPSAIADVNFAYDFSGDTYNFYLTYHGRDSLDNAGMGLISTVRYCEPGYPCPFANAFWSGAPENQMAYGQGYSSADDVVGHELTHGVTNFESNLFYYYQSGAINESFSDVWGEFVDLTNLPADPPADRWLMGEDIPGGAIRSMSNPPVFVDPDKMTSPNYWTDAGDLGGVHSNSGINNKAAYLMVDGGTFNGRTVSALGITKTAAIYYEVQTGLLTSGSDYGDLYNALYQGCLNLVGGPEGITNADCQEVRDATEAVEMNLEPSPGFNPGAEVCDVFQTPFTLFSDDLESGGGNWLASSISGPSAWSQTTGYAHSGIWSLYADGSEFSSDSVMAMDNDVSLPGGSNPYLWFAHAYDFEDPDYDGGWLEYSTNGGGSWSDAGAMIDDGKDYDGTIVSGFFNPNGGHPAFLDTSHGYVSTRLNLASLAGQNVRFRWRMSTDDVFGDLGWLVDDVMIYTCGGATYNLYLPLVLRNFPVKLVNADFESARTGWTEFSLQGWPIILDSGSLLVPPHSGNWAAWLGGVDDEIAYIEQQVTVPVGMPYLAYWHWIGSDDVCGYDFAGVLVNGTVVDVYDLCSSQNTGGWVKHVVDLSSYQGQSVTLQIRAETDFVFNSNLFVDNVAFQSTASREQGVDQARPDGEPAQPKPLELKREGLNGDQRQERVFPVIGRR